MDRLSQRDPRWRNKLLGKSIDTTIGTSGCLLTCLAMVSNGCGMNYGVDELNDRMVAMGAFIDAEVIARMLPGVSANTGYVNYIECSKVEAPIAYIDEAITAGRFVIAQVDSSPAEGIQSHWVLLMKKSAADYTMLDPWPIGSEQEFSLLKRYGNGQSTARIITALFVFERFQDPNRVGKARPYTVLTTVNVRSGAGTNYPALRMAVNGEKIMVVGREGDWLQLQDGSWVCELIRLAKENI